MARPKVTITPFPSLVWSNDIALAIKWGLRPKNSLHNLLWLSRSRLTSCLPLSRSTLLFNTIPLTQISNIHPSHYIWQVKIPPWTPSAMSEWIDPKRRRIHILNYSSRHVLLFCLSGLILSLSLPSKKCSKNIGSSLASPWAVRVCPSRCERACSAGYALARELCLNFSQVHEARW